MLGDTFLAAYTAVNVLSPELAREWLFLAAYTAVNPPAVPGAAGYHFLAAYTAVNIEQLREI
ncbi:hypothetical protein AAIH23_35605, partial [Pseudomonas aeruginosa]